MATKKTEVKPIKFPKKLGTCIDAAYAMRAERLMVQHEVDDMKQTETQWFNHIIDSFSKDEIEGAKGETAVAAIKRQTVVNITNWEELLAWIIKKKRFDLLQKSVSTEGIKELWDSKIEVPGVEPFQKVSLSLTKV